MQLSDDDLKILWQKETKPTPDKRTACLSSELLVRAGEGKLSPSELALAVNHIEQCADCAEEYCLALAVNDWAAEAAETHAEVLGTLPTVTKTKESRWRAWFSIPNLKAPAFALAGLVLLVVGWLAWQSFQKKAVQPEIAVATPVPSSTATPTATTSATPTTPIVAQLQDGQRLVTLNQQGELAGLEKLPPTYQRIVKDALTTQRLERSALLAGLNRAGSSLLGGAEPGKQFAITAPVGKVLLTDRPTFRWSALPSATSYVVEVYDEQFNLITASPPLTTTAWTVPQPLKRGVVYGWQVKASQEGQEFTAPRPPAPPAKFRILAQTNANELAQARRNFGSSHLTMGLLYAQAGLLEEAEQEFRALQQANPNAPMARRWLANVRAMQR